MSLRNVRVEVSSRGEKLARGVCLLVSPGCPRRGTISQLSWTSGERNLTGSDVQLHLAGGDELLATVVRHAHQGGVGYLSFRVAP